MQGTPQPTLGVWRGVFSEGKFNLGGYWFGLFCNKESKLIQFVFAQASPKKMKTSIPHHHFLYVFLQRIMGIVWSSKRRMSGELHYFFQPKVLILHQDSCCGYTNSTSPNVPTVSHFVLVIISNLIHVIKIKRLWWVWLSLDNNKQYSLGPQCFMWINMIRFCAQKSSYLATSKISSALPKLSEHPYLIYNHCTHHIPTPKTYPNNQNIVLASFLFLPQSLY